MPETRAVGGPNSDQPRSGNGRDRGLATPMPERGGRASRRDDFVPRAADGGELRAIRMYAYGIARNRLQQAAKRLHVPLDITDDFSKADAVMTLKNYYRRRPKLIVDAERRGMPVYVLRANTVSQMENFIIDMFNLEVSATDPFGEALLEAENAIMKVRAGAAFIDLTPQGTLIRRRQHELARKAQLNSRSYGDDPGRHVRIYREEPA
jgi:hypothetical protein